ncbi:MAG: SLC13 family permease [Acetobacteraceae bacterium]|nr:SLC13 family permease [Acetobacteraceae bacterium]MBV8525064.1 SLC13 family permease [Acetobacteraceae bacterium]
MTLEQAIAFAILLCTIVLFIWGRLPYDLIALVALFAGIVTGIVPPSKAFEGFANEVVIIIAAALVISAAIARSGVVETLMRPILPRLRTVQMQVPVLVATVTLLSMFTKNVGALAILMPVALQLARRTGTSPSCLLMPMAFGSLLGGIVTLVGTSPNILIAEVRAQTLGKPFSLFDFTPVGLSIAVMGVGFLSFGYRVLPGGRKGAPSIDAAFTIEDYTTEARLSPQSPAAGRTVAELEALGDGDVTVAAIIRERFRRYPPRPDSRLREDDVVLLQGEPENLERLVARARLNLAGGGPEPGDVSVVEGVVTADSAVVGHTPAQLDLRRRYNLTLLAVSRSGEVISRRLGTVRLRAGDVLVLRGASEAVPERLGELRILPLAERSITLGRSRRGWLPAAVLLVAMAWVAVGKAPVAVAFFGAAVVLLLFRVMTMEEAYETIEWHLLILLGALIPLSHAVRDTGGTALIAGWLSSVVQSVPPVAALATILVVTMIITPFLHNAPTVLVIGPIAASLAAKLNLNPDPFLMAVALGAGCDFLTPIGHQCNTLVMGPGGYRFGDYWRLGMPLSILVVLIGVPLIALIWKLSPPS